MRHTHTRCHPLPFRWPDPPLQVVLVSPQIPPNTGNIARLCAATGSQLHLVEPMGFPIDHAKLRRAGLDYWDSIAPVLHPYFEHYLATAAPRRFFLFTTQAAQSYLSAKFEPGDALVFGSETTGLPDALLDRHADRQLGIPIRTDHVRSLNLSSCAALAVYEALRQLQQPRALP